MFRDRLVNDEDRIWFDDLMKNMMLEWGTTFDEVVPFQPLLYGDFMMPGADVKLYELIDDKDKVMCSGFSLPLFSFGSSPLMLLLLINTDGILTWISRISWLKEINLASVFHKHLWFPVRKPK